MYYKYIYETPDDFTNIIIVSDGETMTELFFEGHLDEANYDKGICGGVLPEFEGVKKWLDIYFSGKEPDFTPKFKIEGASDFRMEVIKAMQDIPYGKSTTYNNIAKAIAKKRGIEKMAARAVGGAVGWNPISIIIPCHRVIGSDGSITGYGGGIRNKISLLKLEGNSDFRL